MIIFLNGRHTLVEDSEDLPIIWVDSSDNTSYTLSSNNVLTLDNKGSLGGAMTLNGTVKFANDGFESWSASDYITRDLGEPFLTNNSFTTVTTFDLQDITSGDNSSYNWFVSMFDSFQNRFEDLRNNLRTGYIIKASNVGLTNIDRTNFLGVQTLVSSYDITTNTLDLLYSNGDNSQYLSVVWNNANDILLYLLRSTSITDANSGANNPLHEFRLYNRAFDLTEMQDLQTELNLKYSKPIVWVDSSDTSTYTLSGSDVLTLDNKGSLGGAMTLNGTVKFANSGFESWSASDYITRDLGEPFMTDNSFTIATTFDLQDLNTLGDSAYISIITAPGNNNVRVSKISSQNNIDESVAVGRRTSGSNATRRNTIPIVNGIHSVVFSYDLSTNSINLLASNGSNIFYNDFKFINTSNAIVNLLGLNLTNYNTGANNPLHEFRLYDRAFDLTEMQTLQTELNNKYTP